MHKLVCVSCQVEYVIEKSGATCVDMFNLPPRPYQMYNCDAWKCPGCGHIVLAGFANLPYAQHFEPDFQERLDAVPGMKVYAYERVGDKERYGGQDEIRNR